MDTKIEVGLSSTAVRQILGEPQNIIPIEEDKFSYKYPEMEITFRNDKVSIIQHLKPPKPVQRPEIIKTEVAFAEEKEKVEGIFKGHTSNFYWIAGLSIINSVVMLVGGNWIFLIGLGATQLVHELFVAIAESIGGDAVFTARIIAFIINILTAGIYIVFGIFARRQKKWAFTVGMILYALDGLIFLLVPDFVSIAFHVFMLYRLAVELTLVEKYMQVQKRAASTS
jgi:hypothetical protein